MAIHAVATLNLRIAPTRARLRAATLEATTELFEEVIVPADCEAVKLRQ